MSSEENKKQTNHGVINQGKAQHDFPTNTLPMISVIANKYSWRFYTLAAWSNYNQNIRNDDIQIKRKVKLKFN